VFAVPKSMAMSREKRPNSQLIGLKAKIRLLSEISYQTNYTVTIIP